MQETEEVNLADLKPGDLYVGVATGHTFDVLSVRTEDNGGVTIELGEQGNRANRASMTFSSGEYTARRIKK